LKSLCKPDQERRNPFCRSFYFCAPLAACDDPVDFRMLVRLAVQTYFLPLRPDEIGRRDLVRRFPSPVSVMRL
jgi:hypothetical protein